MVTNRRMVRLIGGWVAAALFACASIASAEPTAEDKALSTELFKHGRQLLEDGKIAEACAKLEESQRLVPADGTLLNLAVCNEKLGKLATAYAAFNDARARARAANRLDRVKLADERIAAIEPRLSRLTVIVPVEVDIPRLRLYRDGSEIGRAAWGRAMPVDPGTHVIEARADGRKTWTRNIDVGSSADQQTITLDALEPDAPPEPEPRAEVVPPSPPPARSPPVRKPQPLVDESPRNGRRTAAFVLGGVGIVGIGIGSYFGVRAFSKWSASDDECRGGHCTTKGTEAAEDARTAADVSTTSFLVGGAALAFGTWLFLTSPDESPTGEIFVRAGYGSGGPSTALGTNF